MSAEVIQDDPEVVVVKVVVKKQKTSLSGTPVTPVHQVVVSYRCCALFCEFLTCTEGCG